jgi:hypothetical protein
MKTREELIAEAASRNAESVQNVRRRQAEKAKEQEYKEAVITLARERVASELGTKRRAGTQTAALIAAMKKRWPAGQPERLSKSDKEALDEELSAAGFPLKKDANEYARRARDTAYRRALKMLPQP